jgi:DNA-binding FadR family transcriptional regulator
MTPRSAQPRSTFQEQVLAQLGKDICSGRYRPGQVLPPEADLCERFAFSRIVIREAIKSLSAKGMLEVRRRVGTLVLEPSRWNLFDPDVMAWRAASAEVDSAMSRDLMELRRIVEPAAVRLAAKNASAEDRRALRAAYMAMVRAVDGKGDYVKADLDFHAAVLLACGNQFLRQMQEAMSALLQVSFKIISEKPGGPAHSLPMHEAVCVAIEAGDQAAAERAALVLIEQAEADMRDRLQRVQAPAAAPKKAPAKRAAARAG